MLATVQHLNEAIGCCLPDFLLDALLLLLLLALCRRPVRCSSTLAPLRCP
jgi:hypothetical protein